MSWDESWEIIYQKGLHDSKWPWSDLVSLMHKNLGDKIDLHQDVLELGVGAGANLPFLLSSGFKVWAIDGSHTCLSLLKERYQNEKNLILAQHDFTKTLPFDKSFDVIVDRASITHGNEKSVRNAIDVCFESLKPGGWIFSLNLFSTKMEDFRNKKNIVDKWTRTKITDGPLAGTGNVHFWNLSHIKNVFNRFNLIEIEERTLKPLLSKSLNNVIYFNVVAQKP